METKTKDKEQEINKQENKEAQKINLPRTTVEMLEQTLQIA